MYVYAYACEDIVIISPAKQDTKVDRMPKYDQQGKSSVLQT